MKAVGRAQRRPRLKTPNMTFDPERRRTRYSPVVVELYRPFMPQRGYGLKAQGRAPRSPLPGRVSAPRATALEQWSAHLIFSSTRGQGGGESKKCHRVPLPSITRDTHRPFKKSPFNNLPRHRHKVPLRIFRIDLRFQSQLVEWQNVTFSKQTLKCDLIGPVQRPLISPFSVKTRL